MRLHFFKRKELRDSTSTITTNETVNNETSSAISAIFGQLSAREKGLYLSSIFRAVSLISNAMATLPIIFYKVDKSGNKTAYKESMLYNILNLAPSKLMTSYQLIKNMVCDLLLDGNAYARIIRDNNNEIIEIRYISSKRVTLVKTRDNNNDIINVRYSIDNYNKLVEYDEMIHIINYPDTDGYLGVSTLEYAKRTSELCDFNESAAEGYFKNGGALAGIIKVAHNLLPKQKQEMKQAWGEAFQGSNANGVAILEGTQDYQTVQSTASDSQLLESRKFNVYEIARFFNVNPILLYSENGSYNSAEEASLSLLTDTLAPIIQKFEDEFCRKLIKDKDVNKYDIRFFTEDFLRQDNQNRADFYRTLFSLGVLSVNEIRAKLDMNKIEGGDEHYVQAQLVTLENSKNIGVSTVTAIDKQEEKQEDEPEPEVKA